MKKFIGVLCMVLSPLVAVFISIYLSIGQITSMAYVVKEEVINKYDLVLPLLIVLVNPIISVIVFLGLLVIGSHLLYGISKRDRYDITDSEVEEFLNNLKEKSGE